MIDSIYIYIYKMSLNNVLIKKTLSLSLEILGIK